MKVSDAQIWIVIVVVAAICILLRAAGPILLRDKDLSPRTTLVIDALAPALLAGLIFVELLGPRWHDLDWTMLPCLPVAAVLRWKHVPDLACIAVAVAITIGIRAAAA